MKTFIISIFIFSFSLFGAEKKTLPVVLFLGDLFTNQLSQQCGKELKDLANVKYIQTEDSKTTLENWDNLLGKSKWSDFQVVYFNFGFNDLVYKVPGIKTTRVLTKDAGGVRVSTKEEYKLNLEKIVEKLKLTNTKLIWGNTTPIVEGKLSPMFDVGSEIEFNAIADSIMKKKDIAQIDLHSIITQKKNGVKNFDGISYGKGTVEIPYEAVIKEIKLKLEIK